MMYTYEKNGKVITYQVIKKRIKNTYFRVKEGMICVTTNHRTHHQLILSYIDLKFDQLYAKLLLSKTLEPDYEITLWNNTYQMTVQKGRFAYEIKDQMVLVSTQKTDFMEIKKAIYKKELLKKLNTLNDKIEHTIASKGLRPLPMKLKYLKSKFGSYHRKHHEITLNTFLARLDPVYLEYVIYHEYAHVLVFNHSKDFYNLLSEFMPNHRLYQKDLKKIAII